MDKIIEVELKSDEKKLLRFYGKIVRVDKISMRLKYNYDLGVSFKKIDNKDNEAIN